MDDCIEYLEETAVFSELDANCGHQQVTVAEKYRDNTEITSIMGIFRFLWTPFGLRNAPATFQSALDIVLSGLCWQLCLLYSDDVTVLSKDIKETLAIYIKQSRFSQRPVSL